MKNYLAIIRKSDFIDLYRYGHFHISTDTSVEFTCTVEELNLHNEIFEELITYANAFDNAFVYLMIHYTLNDYSAKNSLNIEDVQHVFPLDYESKKEFSTSFDSKINICEPIWNNAIYELQKKWAVQSCYQGAQNIWKIFGINYPIEKVQQIVNNTIISEIIEELYSGRYPSGKLPLLVYLLRYERHAFYPKSPVGYFMDAIHAFSNYLYEREQESIENSNAYSALCKFKDRDNSTTIIKKCQKDKSLKKLFDLLNERCPEFNYFAIAPLYLFLRNKYNDGVQEKDYIKFAKEIQKNRSEEEVAIAFYLLGVVLGHEKTYDALYESLPLAIYKPKETLKKLPENQSEKKHSNKAMDVSNKKSNEKTSTNTTINIGGNIPLTIEQNLPDDTINKEEVLIPSKINNIGLEDISQSSNSYQTNDLFRTTIEFPCFMAKCTKQGKIKKNLKSDDIKKVKSKEEYEKLENEGYKLYNK